MAEPFGDLIVVIPGILGSRLARCKKNGKPVTAWDFSIATLPRLLKEIVTGGLVLEGDGENPPNDGIEAMELFSYQLLPGFFGVDDYASLVSSLQRSVGANQVITFPYDWRLSNRHAAKRLEAKAIDALNRWKADSGNDKARLWLVCHSMGGLVARYFCEHLGGSAHTRAVITIGTPHRGSVRALDALVNGKRLGPFDVTRLVRSLPSAYELLPLFPAVRRQSESTVELLRVAELFGLNPVTGEDVPGWVDPTLVGQPPALPGLDRRMLMRALQFHAELRMPAEARAASGTPSPYRQEAFFNRRQRTALSARLVDRKLELFDTYPESRGSRTVEDDPRGDGTVPSFSSVPVEWEDTQRAIAVGEKHAAMQCAVALHDTIFNWLHPLDVRAKKGGPVDDAAVVELDVPATILVGEDLTVSAAALRPTNLSIEVVHAGTGVKATRPLALSGGDSRKVTQFHDLLGGVYRVTARPADQMMPAVSDYVYVSPNDVSLSATGKELCPPQ